MTPEPTTRRFELFPAAELTPGEMRPVDVDGLAMLIIHTPDGEFHALRDVCPHQGARLSPGYVELAVDSDGVGQYRLSSEYAVRCPWHGHEFSVSDGRCLADPQRIRVRSYRVGVEYGTVVLWR